MKKIDTRGLFCRIVWRKKSSPFVENQIEGRYGVIQAENRAFISIKSNHKRPSIELQRMPSFSVTHRTHQIHLHCQYLGIPTREDVKHEGVC